MKRTAAAFMFFTRLPLWRICNVPASYFSRVVELWPLVGWLTGSVAAGVYFVATLVFPPLLAAVLALAARMMLTGALHEDGLADFFDGFGAGGDRQRILAIMKDSHIGTYGVLAIVFYSLLAATAIASLPIGLGWIVILCADPWSKFCASQIINFLPYARNVEDAKIKTIYQRFSLQSWIIAFAIAILPIVLMPLYMYLTYLAPVCASVCIILFLRHKLDGYTGDCCGACFLLSELSFLLCASAIWKLC